MPSRDQDQRGKEGILCSPSSSQARSDPQGLTPLDDGGWKAAARALTDALADERDLTIALNGLLIEARAYVADALDAHEHSDGRELLQRIDAKAVQP